MTGTERPLALYGFCVYHSGGARSSLRVPSCPERQMYYDISRVRLSLLTPSHPLAGTMMPRSTTRCILGDYSPNVVEEEFSEMGMQDAA
jgi:hypothetical protein